MVPYPYEDDKQKRQSPLAAISFRPPRYVRAVRYRYWFAPPGAGRWWQRERQGLWLVPLSADDPRLRRYLRSAQWD